MSTRPAADPFASESVEASFLSRVVKARTSDLVCDSDRRLGVSALDRLLALCSERAQFTDRARKVCRVPPPVIAAARSADQHERQDRNGPLRR